MAAALAENLDEIADEDSDLDVDDAPIFTPELALLKAKESGQKIPSSAADDDDKEIDDEDMNDEGVKKGQD